jgi:hypothetical protein
MKKHYFYTLALAIIALASCTKKETIIQQYNPPSASIYGTWLLLGSNPLDSSKQYWIFPNDGSNFFDELSEDKYGFRKIGSSYIFNATDKQIFISSMLMNYTVANDTLTLLQSRTSKIKAVRVPNPGFTSATFLTPLTILKSSLLHKAMSSLNYSAGIKGDTLLYTANITGSNRLYKFSLNDRVHTDSHTLAVAGGGTYYKSGTTFLGFTNNNKIWKGTEIKSFSPNSSNQLTNVTAISLNGASNTYYAYQGDKQLFAGTDGGSYSLLFNFNAHNTNMVVYHNSDAFLVLKDNAIHKIKIFPKLQVLNSFSLPSEYQINSISSNGVDVWAQVKNNSTIQNLFVKLSIP